MRDKLEHIRAQALDLIANTQTAAALEEVRVRYLGRKGEITDVLRGLGQVAPEERPALGQAANHVKDAISAELAEGKDWQYNDKIKRLIVRTKDYAEGKYVIE